MQQQADGIVVLAHQDVVGREAEILDTLLVKFGGKFHQVADGRLHEIAFATTAGASLSNCSMVM